MRLRPPRPWMLVSAAWIIPAVLGTIDALAQQRLWGGPPVGLRRLLFSGGDWLLYALLTPAVFAISRRWPLVRGRLRRRAALHVAVSLLFCVAWAGAGTLLRLALSPDPLQGGIARNLLSWIFTTLPFGVAVYLAVVGIEHAVRYFVEARERDLQLARLSGQLSEVRLRALQARLNPHFLFNSLNTVAVLVRDGDVTAATGVIEHLSDVLRLTLRRTDANEVALAGELELVRQYLAVERARFPDRLRPDLDIDPVVWRAAVPSFAVQHLVENAVRHGVARRTNAGRVGLTARRDGAALEITVTDDGPGADAGALEAVGHGLDTTRERLRTLYGTAASLTVTSTSAGTVARMRIPYRLATDADDVR